MTDKTKENKANLNPDRKDIPEEMTWDLTTIYPNDEAWNKEFEALQTDADRGQQYAGKLAESGKTLLEAQKALEEQMLTAFRLMMYAHLKSDQDVGNADYQAMQSRISQLGTKIAAAWAYYEPEAANITEEQFNAFVEEEEGLEMYAHEFENLRREKPHKLSQKEEILLAKSGEVFAAPQSIYGVFSNADMKFPVIKDADGNDVELTHANFIKMLESKDRRVRKDAFEQYYSVFKQFRNTIATILEAAINGDNVIAEMRNFKTAREAALFNNVIPESVHDQLIEVVNKNLDLLHRFVALRKKMLKLDELHCYDLYVSTVDSVDYHIDFEDTEELLLKALAPLGEDYLDIIRKAFKERWIDWATNKGKRSGAYSSGSYDTNPYILISWQGTLDNLFTLAHELGHSAHSYLTRKNQPQIYGDYSIFLAEIASTTNENLLTEYLLKTEEDPDVRRYIINHYLDGFKGTVFRQTQFAEFEHLMHESLREGQPLTGEFLNEKYYEINKKYYGDALVHDDEIALEWARIPHFFYNYYVYQYATGFSAATAFAYRILNEGEEAVKDYIGYLSAGKSDYPIEVLKKAGLDMTSPEPVEKAMKSFEHYLDMFEELSE